MSLRCSIFGHKYGQTEVEREREEDGSEVVITIREHETCQRCGEVRVVSENKEVTTLETAADIVADDFDDEPEAAEAPAEEQPPAEPQSADVPEGEPTIPDAESGEQVSTPTEAPTPDAEEDDGVILEDEPEEPDETDEEGREPGEWPEEPDDGDDEWEPETSPEHEAIEPETEVEPTGSAVTVPEGIFYCPECEFSTPVDESSLREGDFCPECHRGSLEHRNE
jgi:hypothetical protein